MSFKCLNNKQRYFSVKSPNTAVFKHVISFYCSLQVILRAGLPYLQQGCV